MSGNRRSEDAGEVPWPALVDLLTSVLIAFMFFILITTVAMSTMTMKMAEDISEKRQKDKDPSPTEVLPEEATPKPVEAMSMTEVTSSTILPPPSGNTVESEDQINERENDRLKAENELLKQQLAAMGASFAKSQEIKLLPSKAGAELTMLFNPNEAGTTPESEAALARYVKQLPAGQNVQITASEPDGVSFSQARERALTRAMVIRNKLLENGVDPRRISFRYSNEEHEKSRNWVRLEAVAPQRKGDAQ
ncbi:MAG: hypothetical protein DI585_00010 [Pseudomonas fluorescens]|nr:MAG: hypothetical protein DI585_00010 [Pseudomonas fluorescens]